MGTKIEVINKLNVVFWQWTNLLATLGKDQIHQPLEPSTWTLKDNLAHLWAWQQGSVARAEAALQNRSPIYPAWWEACGPDPNEDVDRTNDYIYLANKDKTWEAVSADWKSQFQRYLELLKQIPEKDLVEAGKYPWMSGYALIASPEGSWDHHREHYEAFTDWLGIHTNTKSMGG